MLFVTVIESAVLSPDTDKLLVQKLNHNKHLKKGKRKETKTPHKLRRENVTNKLNKIWRAT